jgi:hypothetical protein
MGDVILDGEHYAKEEGDDQRQGPSQEQCHVAPQKEAISLQLSALALWLTAEC